jgi:hypothetical protein
MLGMDSGCQPVPLLPSGICVESLVATIIIDRNCIVVLREWVVEQWLMNVMNFRV